MCAMFARQRGGLVTLEPCQRTRSVQAGARFKNNCFTEMCGGSKEGSYLRLIDFCITVKYLRAVPEDAIGPRRGAVLRAGVVLNFPSVSYYLILV